MAEPLYEFGPFRLDARDKLLLREGKPVALPPKVSETLVLLLRRAGHVVEKDEILKIIWPDTFVEEASLTQNISILRKALGESEDHHYIETIPKRGYRFVAPVRLLDQREAPWTARRRFIPLITLAAAVAALAVLPYLKRETSAVATPPPSRSIAVLPLVPIGAPTSDEYLGLGIADALITKLANLQQITVRPTSSVRKFVGSKRDAVAAGRELAVESVMDGSIQRAAGRVRVTMQLIRVADGTPLWTGSFDEKFTDLLSVQDAIADSVTKALALSLTARDRIRLKKRDTDDVEAYESYLRGRFYWNKRTEEGFTKAVVHFTRAIELDPLYARAYAGLADCYNLFNNYDLAPATETGPKAKAAALKALEIDSELAEAHTSLALVREVYDFDQIAADQSYRRAIELNPNYSTAHHWYGLFLVQMGRTEEAIQHLQRARDLDPLSNIISVGVAWAHYFARQHERAIEISRKNIEVVPDFWPAHLVLGWSYEQTGKFEEARNQFNRAIDLSGRNTLPLASLGHLHAISGKQRDALRILAEIEARSRERYVSAYFPAAIQAGLGRKAEALAWLDRAERERAYWLISIHVNPWFDGLRDEPRFQQLERNLGFQAFAEAHGKSATGSSTSDVRSAPRRE